MFAGCGIEALEQRGIGPGLRATVSDFGSGVFARTPEALTPGALSRKP